MLDTIDAAFEPHLKVLTGVGGRKITTKGCMKTKVKLDAIELDMEFHIVRESDILYPSIIGNDILDKWDLIGN